jgi:hypothetical protein
VGLAGIAAFVIGAGLVIVLRSAMRAPSVELYTPGPTLSLLVELTYRIVVNPPAFEYVVPALIWLASFATWARAVSPDKASAASAKARHLRGKTRRRRGP